MMHSLFEYMFVQDCAPVCDKFYPSVMKNNIPHFILFHMDGIIGETNSMPNVTQRKWYPK